MNSTEQTLIRLRNRIPELKGCETFEESKEIVCDYMSGKVVWYRFADWNFLTVYGETFVIGQYAKGEVNECIELFTDVIRHVN